MHITNHKHLFRRVVEEEMHDILLQRKKYFEYSRRKNKQTGVTLIIIESCLRVCH